MSQVVPSSKMSLKLSCLSACGNDIDKAERLYAYLAADMDGLPDMDPVRPSGFEQVKRSADEVLAWIGEHREDFSRGLSLIQSLRKTTPSAPMNVPPIPTIQ